MCGKQGICPHDFRQSRKEPTCTKKGEIKQICEICGYNYTETELPAKGHDYSVEIKEVPVSCTEDGVTAGRKCGRCGYVDGCEAIPAAGHHMELTSPKRPANCTETGTAAVMTCSVCGYTEGGDEIPAKGHLDYEEDGICDECGK